MIPAIQEINFPSYATLHQATVSFTEMGERTISTQVRIDGDVVPDFTGWELSFKGERFILNTKDPQAVKDNSTRNSLVDLTFVSWPVNELKRYFFFEPTSIDASTAIADKYVAPVNLPVEDFAVLFNKVLKYYFGDKVVFSLYMSGQGQYSTDRALVEINYTYIWDVLVKFFEIYGVRWRIEYDESDDVYTIKAGWPTTDIDINDHDFEYGYKGGLVRFERQVQDVDIHNILLGRGGEKNIPYRYFKRVDPQNPDWAADPDAIPELANIYFDRLRDINFRWYVRGWMQNPNHDTSWEDGGYVYPTYTITSDSPYYFAYEKGRTDEKFNPVEYVKDDESIADYGEHWGALDDNDDIFPTIQSVSRDPLGRIDETVAVSEIVTDDISAMAQNAAVEKSINRLSVSLNGETRTEFDLQSEEFTIPSGSTGNITYVPFGTDNTYPGLVRFDTDNSTVVAVSDGIEYPIDAIPAGTYRLKLHMVIARSGQATSATGTFGIENIILTTSSQETDAWKPTFDIWVKNIWGTEKQEGETDVQYAERVWLPILGDRVGNEANIVFSTGFMSVSEDYEFPIVSYPVHDTSKSINGVPSEWRITLRKSDAEFDATGLYIPNASTGGKPVAGDNFFFIGIDMPFRHVTLAEEDLNTYKSAQLDTEAAISPTWIMNLDKVRVHSLEDEEYGRTLADRLAAGGKVWIKDKRFTPGKRLQLYVQSITYTWNEPTVESPYIVPDIEVVLSDKVVAVDSVVQRIQNDVSSIKNQYARISDVEAVVRSVAEPIFLKKTGESDSSDSPTQFSSKVTSKGFRQGGVGGSGWGIYRDNTSVWAEAEAESATRTRGLLRAVAEERNTEGDTVFEADRIVVRKELQVNSLVINQISYLGGKEIISAAKIEVSKVIETEDGYVCYFDQRRNSVANNFVVNDIAMGQVFDPYNAELRYYKALVTAVDIDSITISKTQKVGSGVPLVGDVIVQYGNTTQSGRQYVIVRDVVGGGYERMLSGLDSLSSDGDEYYFAGRESSGTGPRWFVGSHEQNGDYAEYENGVLTIKANVVFKQGQVIPGLSDLTDDVEALEYLKTALPKSDTIITGGLILSKVIALRDANNNIMSGINGDTSLSNIAAWYGGPMADKEASPTPASYAKSLFRFDGSGYLAGGNIHWNNQGYGGIPGITWSNDGTSDVVTIGANVRLASVDGDTVTDLLRAVNELMDLFEVVNGNIHVKNNRGFYSDSFISAGGLSDGGGSAGGNATLVAQSYGGTLSATGINPINFYSKEKVDELLLTAGSVRSVAGVSPVSGDIPVASLKSALGLGAAAAYGVGSVASGNTGLVTGGSVYSAINEAVSSVLKMQGTTTTAISDGSTTNPIVIDGSSYTAKKGDVVMYGNKEFWWTGSAWEELGDEASWALKTTTISAGTGLTGGGSLASNRTISLSDSTIASLALANTALQSVAFSDLTSHPTTLSGYAISDAKIDGGVITLGNNTITPVTGVAVGGSGHTNELAITSGGTTTHITVPFATSATTASKLSTVSKTVWGVTYWTSGGVPTNVTGRPTLYIARTQVNTSAANDTLLGITAISNAASSGSSDKSRIVWDADHEAWHFIGNVYADGFVSAGGLSDGSGTGGIDPDAMWALLANTDSTKQINAAHLSTALAPYATQNWVQDQGYLTAHQSLDGYVNALTRTPASGGNYVSAVTKSGKTITVTYATLPTSLPASDVYSWAKAETKPSYAFSEITGTASTSQIPTLAISKISGLQDVLDGKQPLDADLTAIAGLTGTSGFLKKTAANTWALDTNTYLTGNQTITLSGDVTGSGTTAITTTIGAGKVTNAMLAGSIANAKLANSSITINGSSTSLGGSFSTASITAGTAGTSSATSGLSISVPYVTMNKYGIVTAYGTHTHSISKSDLTTSLESSNGYYVKKSGDTMTGDLYIITGDTDKCIQFSYNTSHLAGAAWRIISNGSGTSDTNYLSFQTGGSSSTATTWNNVLRLSMDNRYVGINLDAPAYQLDVAGVTQIAGNPSGGTMLRLKNTSSANAWMGFFGASSAFSYLGAGSQHALILQNPSGTNVFTVATNGAASFSSTLSVTTSVTSPKFYLDANNYFEVVNGKVHLHVGTNGGFYTEGFISAGGLSDSGGSGGVDLSAVWNNLVANTGEGLNKKIHTAHLPTVTITGTNISGTGTYSGTGGSASTLTLNLTAVDTTYSAGTGISLSGTTFSLNVSGAKTALGLGSMAYETASNYLPLNVGAGKTITSSSNAPLNINSTTTSTNEVGFRYQLRGENKAFFGYNASENYGAYMYNYNGPHRLGITDAGVAHFDGYALLHAGNYTSYVNTTNFPGLNKVGTVTSVAAGTGLSGGTITTSGTISLSASGVTAGTYYKTTVDTYGRVTSGSYANLSAAINGDLTEGSSNPVDADFYIAQYADGGTSTTSYHRRPHSALYNYINGKLATAHAGLDKTGTVTSVAMTVPTGLSVSGTPITTSGTLAISLASGYSIPTTAKQSNWDTAYGWGNHANAGYLLASTAASTYLPLTGGIIRSASSYARLRFVTDATAAYIQAGTSDANSGDLQLTAFNGGVGANLYLKFSNIYATGRNYTVYHSGNSNLSTVPWSCSTLTASGNIRVITTGAQTAIRIGQSGAVNDAAGDILFQNGDVDRNGFKISSEMDNYAAMQRLVFYSSANGTSPYTATWKEAMRISSAGHVSIGTTSSNSNLTVNGNIVATGAITAGSASDARLKTNIQPLSAEAAKRIVMALNPVTFTWNEKATELYDQYKGDDLGMIAQEVEPYLPQAVGTIFESYKRLDYTKVISPLVKVAQDHESRIRQLEAENAELRKRLNMN